MGDAERRPEDDSTFARSTSGPPTWPTPTTRSAASSRGSRSFGLFDNTLIVWVCGDNGMSAEGSLNGTPNEVAYFNGFAFTVEQMLPLIPEWGNEKTYTHFAVPWAFAMDTPYKWTKQVASHLGGTRTGTVMSWPKRIKDAGGIRHQFHHVIDIIPTVFDAIGIPQPTMVNGHRPGPVGRDEHGL